MSDVMFVFGSNLQGIHGAGAALHAARWLGARAGVGEGPTGRSYALPTKENPRRRLALSRVREAVERFKAYAAEHTHCTFEVTRVGCGLAGFHDEQIAPLFEDAPANCILPGLWLARRDSAVARVIVTATQDALEQLGPRLDAALARVHRLDGFRLVVEDPAGDARVLELCDRVREWAQAKAPQLASRLDPFGLDTQLYGPDAASIRRLRMCWYATHFLAVVGARDLVTTAWIHAARSSELQVKVFEPGPAKSFSEALRKPS